MISRERIDNIRRSWKLNIPSDILDLLTARDEAEELLNQVCIMMSQLHIEDRIYNATLAAQIRDLLRGGRFEVK